MTWDWTPETLGALQGFLDGRGITHGALTVKRIGDGHSNLTFLVSDGETGVVVRRPPPPPTPPGANDMLREARIVGALAGTAVPVPGVLATAREGEVLDVPLYVMEFAHGHVVTTETPQPLANSLGRREIGESLIDTLAELHAVDYRALGLREFGRPDGFNLRHLQRMGRLIEDDDGRPPQHFTAIDAWLKENAPSESGASLIHNDFRIGNVVVGPEAPGRIAAVLDWELATIGDPLFDVGYFLASVPENDQTSTPTQRLGAAMLEDGYPSRQELADRYARKTGRDLSKLTWYTAMALWKLAVLYEYSRRRAVQGVGDQYYADSLQVQAFLTAAHRAAGLPATQPFQPQLPQEH